MRIYGLTGGIASGKSAAAARFQAQGIPVVDADAIGHEVIAPGGAAEAAVIEIFGEEIRQCGRIDRERLGRLVFADSDRRRQLNALVHPVIVAEAGRRCAQFAETGQATVIVEASLLGEDGQRDPWLTGLILVTCAAAIRFERLVSLRGMSEEDARRRMDAQVPESRKRALADWIITNEGSLEALHARVDEVAEAIHDAAVGS